MLQENNLSASEIMQTEDNNVESLDDNSALIHSADTEMTVKEEVDDHSVTACEKPTAATTGPNECVVAETPSKHLVTLQEDDQTDSEETSRTSHLKIQDNQSQNYFSSSLSSAPLPVNKDIQNGSSVKQFHQQTIQVTGASGKPASAQKNEQGRGRGRRRSRWKLKFHHQALPPEYLDHYEATMAQQEAVAAAKANSNKVENRNKSSSSVTAKTVPALAPRMSPSDKSPAKQVVSPAQCFIKIESDHSPFDSSPSLTGNSNSMDQLQILPIQTLSLGGNNEALNRLQGDVATNKKDDICIVNENPSMIKSKGSNEKFIQGKGLLSSLLANTAAMPEPGSKSTIDMDRKRRSSVIMSSMSNSGNMNPSNSRSSTPSSSIGNSGNNSSSKVMNYQDLPYMGEITLDNMKPRRGRKPKKADICHLIYKNYGTIFTGSPNRNTHLDTEEWPRRKMQESPLHLSSLVSMNNCNTKVKSETVSAPTLKCRSFESLKPSGHINHSDVQNRIISSLLEKRLTAASHDAKKNLFNSMEFSQPSNFNRSENCSIVNSGHEIWNSSNKRITPSTSVSDEPLNLCVKDLNQLKIRLLRKHGNFYEPRQSDVVSVKSEPPSPSEIEEIDINNSPVDSLPKFLDETDTLEIGSRNQTPASLQQGESTPESFPFSVNDCSNSVSTPLLPPDSGNPTGSPLPGGYIYWPNAGVFVHPMALQSQLLYYQKMGAIPLVPIAPADQSQAFLPPPIPQVNLIPHITPPSGPPPSQTNIPKNSHIKEPKAASNKSVIPKAFSMMMDASIKPSQMPSELNFPRMKRLAPLGNPPTIGTPTKRKRSAIFIPPMPSENSTNPTTEVSICKFKFTGGAKPSLQEKKMLSVDSGGNFRYYSGTGDKSMRGYEFFPRETLQQPTGSIGGSSSEQFLAATASGSGEKIIGNPNMTFETEEHKTGLAETLTKVGADCSQSSIETLGRVTDTRQQIYEQHAGGCVRKKSDFSGKGVPSCSGDNDRFGPIDTEDDPNSQSQFRLRRKRKTRKSLAREKLEQTFKEKGFLIQTQQLESAEGATYCKFRQLRKFTRYLFRSWKDYLPGNVREMSVAAGVAGADASLTTERVSVDSEAEAELSSSNSPHSVSQQTVEDPHLSNT